MIESEPHKYLQTQEDHNGLLVVTCNTATRNNIVIPLRGKDIGCPLLSRTVSGPFMEYPTEVYALYWEVLCELTHEEIMDSMK